MTVVLNRGLLSLPADSPVLIQSGFAMLAIAKISAARNRHPEMIVSLSIPPADEAAAGFGEMWRSSSKVWPRPWQRRRAGWYQSNLAPFNRSPLLWFCCACCSDVSSSASSKREPPAPNDSNTKRKSIASQTPAAAPPHPTARHPQS